MANVQMREEGGDLVFRDHFGMEIARFDGANRKLSFPHGSVLDIDATAAIVSLADGSLARAKLVTETVFVDLEERLKGADGADLALSETADDFFRNKGTTQWFIDGEATINETELSTALFAFVLPENYVAGGTITIRVAALVVLAGDAVNNAASTIDVTLKKQTDATGAVGSDLVSTAPATLATAGANYDFVVTPTDLVAGDKLIGSLATSMVETAAGTGAANSRITKFGALIQVKG